MFRHILFPVDFSAQSVDVMRHVRAWAERYGSKVSLLHTIEFGHRSYINWYAYVALVDLEAVRNEARRRLREIGDSGFSGIPHHCEVSDGDAAQAISHYATDNAVDLIMMATTGQGRLRRMLIGSVAAKVLYDAPSPVWTDVHRHMDEERSATSGPVLCAVDGSNTSCSLIRTANSIASAENTSVHVVHVMPGELVDEAAARDRIEAARAAAGVAAPVSFLHGELPKALRDEAERLQSRLMVIGRGHMHAVLGRMRTHVNSIIERAPCPVLSV